MSKIGCLSVILNMFFNVHARYMRMTPEQRSRTKFFGAYSIGMSIVCSALFVLILWGIVALLPNMDGLGIFVVVPLVVILSLCELVLLGELIVGGLFGIIYQARCNKSIILWISLIVFLLVIAAMVIGILFIFDIIGLEL